MEEEKMYTVNEVAAQLRVSRYTILRYIHNGTLGAEQIGQQYRIPHGSIAEFRRRAQTRRK